MNQFDELFEKKLNEEQSFGGQKRSWTQLNHDLNAFEVGTGVAAKSLALWKAVSVVAILSSVALLWERQHLVRENDLLKQMPQQEQQNITKDKQQDMADIPAQSSTKSSANNAPTFQPSQHAHNNDQIAEKNTITPARQYRSAEKTKISSAKVVLPNTASGQKTGPALPHPVEADNAPETTRIAAVGHVETPSIPSDKNLKAEATDAKTDLKTVADSSAAIAQNMPVRVDAALQKPPTQVDSVQQAPAIAAAPVIDPVRSRPSRWQAGVRMSLGYHLPQEKGLSVVKGQGVGVAFRVWNNLSITASADFMQYDVNTDSLPEHYFSLKLPPPSPGHHFFDLENVSSNQIMQQYNLGLRYAFKLVGPFRVSVNAALTWVHQPSRLASLRFEEMQPHGPGPGGHPDDEYLTIQSPKAWNSNIWRLGLGVQYETPRWSFGLNGDYAKRLNNDKPSFDTAYASAEVMYKF